GDKVKIDYVGTFRSDGKQFDANKGFECKIGVGHVIKGWDEGVVQLSVGEKAKLIITSDYAYGSEGYPLNVPKTKKIIPPNADLVL
ncbi:6818_t:CDS:2, partial [Funneliformis mosseae]